MSKSRSSCRVAAASVIAVICLALTPPAVASDDSGFYVGANVGRILSTYKRADLDNGVINAFGGSDAGFALSSSSVQKDHFMYSADVGYMLTRNLGIEASYLYLGGLRYSSSGTQPATSGNGDADVIADVKVRSHGPALALVGSLPMSNIWEVDARLGAYEGKTTSTYFSAFESETNPGKLSKTSTSLMVGIGTALTLTSHCVVRLDYLRLEHLDEQVFEKSFNVDLVTVGLAYVF